MAKPTSGKRKLLKNDFVYVKRNGLTGVYVDDLNCNGNECIFDISFVNYFAPT